MSITKQQAWTIFEAVSLGKPAGEQAQVLMTDEDMEDYEAFESGFKLEVAKIGVEAQNEAALIQAENPELIAALGETPMNRWNAAKYTQAVSMFKGSKYEQLHLSAMFRISNNELLLELAAPQP